MKLRKTKVTSFSKLINKLLSYNCGHCVFRGVSDSTNELMPSIGRVSDDVYQTMGFDTYEREIINLFKQRSYGEVNSHAFSIIDWMALAQHHGLPTRLLDWTTNPLVASFFATSPDINKADFTLKDREKDAAIYVMHKEKYTNIDTITNPFEIKEHTIMFPKHISNRISGQFGLFSIHPNPCEPFNESIVLENCDFIEKIIIPKAIVSDVRNKLYILGVRNESIFPNLDGYSSDFITRLNIQECSSESNW